MNVLVTGAAGFIGSQLTERLLARGDRVVGVDNFDPSYSAAEKRRNVAAAGHNDRFLLIEADLRRECEGLSAALERDPPQVIVHLAGRTGVRASLADPAGYAGANVAGTLTVLDLARHLGTRRVVMASSSSVYGRRAGGRFQEDDAVEPVSPYAATKRAAELLCRAHQERHGGSIICLRFFTVYGPRQRPDMAVRMFCSLMAQGRPIPLFGDGTAARDYTWIGDILDGTVAAVDRSGVEREEFQIINLGGSRTTDLHRLVALLGDALGMDPRVRHLPPQPGDAVHTWADVRKAERLLGYRPSTPIEVGIPQFVEWFRREGAASPPAPSQVGVG
jgi:UDP-glucuronate 4-epimerase